MHIIARIHTDFPTKFGIPRQSNLIEELHGQIVFEPQFRNQQALRGLDGYSHLWILWKFETNNASTAQWHATVRPPRLGGNKRVGVFATRSPNRPNPIGLSCVRLRKIDWQTSRGPIIHVSGIDMKDGTAIYDIKPYLPYCDSQPEAQGGFAEQVREQTLQVDCPRKMCATLTNEQYNALLQVLSQDPRPQYHTDENRLYGFEFAGQEIKFCVQKNTLRVTSINVIETKQQKQT